MKKNEIKGLSAFALLEGLDDDMILSASLPEAAPVAPPTAGEKITAFFARMGKGGMAAAITGIVVAVAVLLGIALAGPFGVVNPPDTDPSHGIQNGTEADPDTNGMGVAPPLTETPEQEKGKVAVVSDGITVYPRRYDVAGNCYKITDEGEELVWSEGGGIYLMEDIYKDLPVLMTAGGSFSQTAPESHGMGRVSVFDSQFQELSEPTSIEELSKLDNGTYYVQQLATVRRQNTATEYVVNTLQYAFCLVVDRSLNHTAPVRVIHGDKTYYPTRFPLQSIYYDAELQKEVVKNFDGAESILQELIPSLPTATVTQGESLSLYLAPFYDLKSVKVYRNLTLWAESEAEEPLTQLSEWDTGDYYLIITAAFMGTGETTVDEYPIHIRIVEEREEESTPAGDVGETPLPPRVSVGSSYGGLDFGNTSHSSEYHEGYMLWTEQWYDGGMISGDGFGATGQLSEIADGLPVLRHNAGETPYLRVYEDKDTLTRIYVYRDDHSFHFDTAEAQALSTLSAGRYIIVLRVETQGDYIEEADTYERTCTEYAFWLDVVEAPETNPRVVVSGGGQSAVFETEEDGFLAWTAYRLDAAVNSMHRVEVTPADSVIFTDDDALRALPDMEIVYGTPLTLSLGAAGDELVGVILYDAKGGVTAEGDDLSVVDTLENDGWDKGVILVLQVLSRISETEHFCYEYAVNLTITQP